jgi:hypothetical protein
MNLIAAIALIAGQAENAGANLGISILMFLIGVPVAFSFWYRSIYDGVKRDRSISFMLFFINYGVHLGVMILMSIGIPGWGGAGFIYTLQAFAKNQIGAGVLCILALSLFWGQCLYGLWHLRLAIVYYRSKGLSAEEAKSQALQGAAKSAVGQAFVREVVKSSVV